jgi:AsmA protein
MLKGRAVLAGAADGIDFKGQGSFERVDVGSLLSDLGASRWITGPAQGQLAVESSGDSAADLVHRLRGRASIAVRQGELVGVALNEALRRAERRPLTAPLEWRGGRTPFEQAYINATILDGAAEITEAGMTAPSLHAAAQGRVSLAERAVAAKAKVESTPGSGTTSGILFDISGPWDDVAIVPDAQSLMKRSGEPLPGRQDETLEGSTGQ